MAYKRTYRKKEARRFRPKWKLGAGIRFPGGIGGNINFDSRVKKIAKRVALKSQETKETVRRIVNHALTHSTVYTTNLLAMGVGHGYGLRKDDKIFLCGINIKYEIVTPEPDTFWRIMVVRSKDKFLSTNVNPDGFGTGMTAASLFRNNDMSPVGYLNSDNLNLLASKKERVRTPYVNAPANIREGRINVRVMQPYEYETGQIYDGKNYNYYLVVTTWNNSHNPIVGTTPMGRLTVSTELVYKDA